MMKISVTKLRPSAQLPEYQTQHSAGMDLHADIPKALVLKPRERYAVPTGIAIALPEGFEAQVRGRSGLAAKHGVTIANGIGTIDADYRGEIHAIVINHGQEDFTIEPGMRIAQMVIARYERAMWDVVDELDETARGKAGFGSTGAA
jgi:dUTP pyrophosphatase